MTEYEATVSITLEVDTADIIRRCSTTLHYEVYTANRTGTLVSDSSSFWRAWYEFRHFSGKSWKQSKARFVVNEASAVWIPGKQSGTEIK